MPERSRYDRLERLLNPRGFAFVGGAAVELPRDTVTLLRANGHGAIAVDGVIKIATG